MYTYIRFPSTWFVCIYIYYIRGRVKREPSSVHLFGVTYASFFPGKTHAKIPHKNRITNRHFIGTVNARHSRESAAICHVVSARPRPARCHPCKSRNGEYNTLFRSIILRQDKTRHETMPIRRVSVETRGMEKKTVARVLQLYLHI